MLTVEQQEQLLDRAGVLVVVLTLDGRIVHFNRRCEDVTGYAAAELEGRKIWDVLLMPDEVETYQRIYTRLRNSALPDGYDTWWRMRDGTPKLIRWTNQGIYDGDSDTPELIVVTGIVAERTLADEAALQHLAYHDELTGLWNRRRFMEEASHEIARLARTREVGVLLAIDVDDLKVVNDERGHAAGDALLRHVGHVLRDRLRVSDTVARIGGDEFAVLLPATGPVRGTAVGRQLVEAVALHPVAWDAGSFGASISVGVAPLTGLETLDESLARADAALYAAKRDGGNRVFNTNALAAGDRTERSAPREESSSEGRRHRST